MLARRTSLRQESPSSNTRCGSVVKRQAHMPEIGGSNPSSARHFLFSPSERWMACLVGSESDLGIGTYLLK
jgi:hypothetical protein